MVRSYCSATLKAGSEEKPPSSVDANKGWHDMAIVACQLVIYG